jgi:hypothetical protein
MFSFFKSKKPNPPAEGDPIPHANNVNNTGPGEDDEFTFVERKPLPVGPGGNNIYPVIGPAGQHPNIPPFAASKKEQEQISYLQGIPFKLSQQLTSGDTTQITQLKIDQIESFISKRQQANLDYDFSLERTIVSE